MLSFCLHDILNLFFFDILNFSNSQEELIHHVQSVLQCLLKNRLFVKAKKCQFHASSDFFGIGHCLRQYPDGPDRPVLNLGRCLLATPRFP